MAPVTVRVDEETKDRVTQIAEDFGFDISSITRAFYRQVVRENRIPLTLSYPEPNDESAASIREAEDILAAGQHRFASRAEMWKSMGVEIPGATES